MTVTDDLTGLSNRRLFGQTLQREWARSVRSGQPLSLIMLDVDRFKEINDSCGHPAGDLVLRSLAERITGTVREMDTAFRYGGEEFAVLLPETDHTGARAVAERIRQAVAGTPVQADSESLSVTVSLGVATRDGERYGEPNSLVQAADGALYQAKENGRNQVWSV